MWRKGRLKRFRKIINIMVKYGFGQLIHDSGIEELTRHIPYPLHRKSHNTSDLSKAQRFRMALEELGPTFIKFGQLLSTRADVIPPDYIKELRHLQDQVRPFPDSEAKKVVEEELNYPLDVLFETFDETPLAAASIGQVHRAVLPGGKKVVVKIQRPNIQKTIEQDLGIIEEIAALLDKYTYVGRFYHLREIVEEFKRIILLELNYHHEARNAEKFQKNFINDDNVLFPDIHWAYTTQKVLTMDYIEGVTLNNPGIEGHFNKRTIVENLTRAYLKQILEDGFFHGDPHPGNIGVRPGEKIFFLDFGVAGTLSEEQRKAIGRLLFGFTTGNSEYVLSSVTKLGIITDNTDRKKMKWELERLQEKYYDLPLKDIQLGQLLHDLMEISYKQHIRFPPDFTLLAKTFLTLEGLISELEPDFSMAELLGPFGKRFFRRQFSKKNIAAALSSNLLGYARLLEILPDHISAILEKGALNNLRLKIESVDIDMVLHRLSNMFNRLSFSIVLASIILGFCLLIQYSETTLFNYLPIAEVGLILAATMGFWWLWAILRSGRL